jgi:hypothetical protein
MDYCNGDFYLIEDHKYKANKFIGEIIREGKDKEKHIYLIYIYIFPEDTKDSRQQYMSQFEVFLNPVQQFYEFTGIKEQKVSVVSLEDYILLKYNMGQSQKKIYPLYFYRQIYSLEKNIFSPEKLPLICYCREIFNPDIPFQKCVCGNYFHPDCLLQSKEGKCWSVNCNFDCNRFLNEKEQMKKFKLIYGDIKQEIKNITKDLDDDNIFENNLLNKKTYRDKNDDKAHKSASSKEKEKSESNNRKLEKEDNKEDIVATKNDKFISEKKRERVRKIIFFNLIEGKKIIQKDINILEKNQKYTNTEIYKLIKEGEEKLISMHLKELSEQIEKNLYNKYSNISSFYFNYILIFNQCKFDSKELLINIIFGEFTPDEIVQFTEYDFLSNNQKIKVDEKKKEEINKMTRKKDDSELNIMPNISEKEICSEEKNNENECNQKSIDDKVKERLNQFPIINKDDSKMIKKLNMPKEENLKNKLNDFKQENLQLNEQNKFYDKTGNILEKEAKKNIKKDK